jgi:hypothetical protein
MPIAKSRATTVVSTTGSMASKATVIQPVHRSFDAAATLKALKASLKKRDSSFKKAKVAPTFLKATVPSKLGPSSRVLPGYSFRSSIPLIVEPEARLWLSEKSSVHKATGIVFKKSSDKRSIGVYLVGGGREEAIGSLRVEMERDVQKQDPLHLGLIVRMDKSKKSIDFAIHVPRTPAVLRSPEQSDQGGLTHQLKISTR